MFQSDFNAVTSEKADLEEELRLLRQELRTIAEKKSQGMRRQSQDQFPMIDKDGYIVHPRKMGAKWL